MYGLMSDCVCEYGRGVFQRVIADKILQPGFLIGGKTAEFDTASSVTLRKGEVVVHRIVGDDFDRHFIDPNFVVVQGYVQVVEIDRPHFLPLVLKGETSGADIDDGCRFDHPGFPQVKQPRFAELHNRTRLETESTSLSFLNDIHILVMLRLYELIWRHGKGLGVSK